MRIFRNMLCLNLVVVLVTLSRSVFSLKLQTHGSNQHKIDVAAESKLIVAALNEAQNFVYSSEAKIPDLDFRFFLQSKVLRKLQSAMDRWSSIEDAVRDSIVSDAYQKARIFDDAIISLGSSKALMGYVYWRANHEDIAIHLLHNSCPLIWEYHSIMKSSDIYNWLDCFISLRDLYSRKDFTEMKNLEDSFSSRFPWISVALMDKSKMAMRLHPKTVLSELRQLSRNDLATISLETRRGWSVMEDARGRLISYVSDFVGTNSLSERRAVFIRAKNYVSHVISAFQSETTKFDMDSVDISQTGINSHWKARIDRDRLKSDALLDLNSNSRSNMEYRQDSPRLRVSALRESVQSFVTGELQTYISIMSKLIELSDDDDAPEFLLENILRGDNFEELKSKRVLEVKGALGYQSFADILRLFEFYARQQLDYIRGTHDNYISESPTTANQNLKKVTSLTAPYGFDQIILIVSVITACVMVLVYVYKKNILLSSHHRKLVRNMINRLKTSLSATAAVVKNTFEKQSSIKSLEAESPSSVKRKSHSQPKLSKKKRSQSGPKAELSPPILTDDGHESPLYLLPSASSTDKLSVSTPNDNPNSDSSVTQSPFSDAVLPAAPEVWVYQSEGEFLTGKEKNELEDSGWITMSASSKKNRNETKPMQNNNKIINTKQSRGSSPKNVAKPTSTSKKEAVVSPPIITKTPISNPNEARELLLQIVHPKTSNLSSSQLVEHSKDSSDNNNNNNNSAVNSDETDMMSLTDSECSINDQQGHRTNSPPLPTNAYMDASYGVYYCLPYGIHPVPVPVVMPQVMSSDTNEEVRMDESDFSGAVYMDPNVYYMSPYQMNGIMPFPPMLPGQFMPAYIDNNAYASPIDNRMEMLQKQIEYYFSPENLCKDAYLRSQMDKDGYVKLGEIFSFRRIQQIKGTPAMLLLAVRNSSSIEVMESWAMKAASPNYSDIQSLESLPTETILSCKVRCADDPLRWIGVNTAPLES